MTIFRHVIEIIFAFVIIIIFLLGFSLGILLTLLILVAFYPVGVSEALRAIKSDIWNHLIIVLYIAGSVVGILSICITKPFIIRMLRNISQRNIR